MNPDLIEEMSKKATTLANDHQFFYEPDGPHFTDPKKELIKRIQKAKLQLITLNPKLKNDFFIQHMLSYLEALNDVFFTNEAAIFSITQSDHRDSIGQSYYIQRFVKAFEAAGNLFEAVQQQSTSSDNQNNMSTKVRAFVKANDSLYKYGTLGSAVSEAIFTVFIHVVFLPLFVLACPLMLMISATYALQGKENKHPFFPKKRQELLPGAWSRKQLFPKAEQVAQAINTSSGCSNSTLTCRAG